MSVWSTLEAAAAWRASRSGTVAVVAGAFDILHPGNLAALRQARREADCTVVLLEPDAAGRPDAGGSLHHPQAVRAAVVAALRDVEAVGVAAPDAQAWADALRPFVWVTRAGAPVVTPLGRAVAQAATERREVAGPAGCTTAAIHAAMAAANTPIRVPEAVYPAPASDDPGPARGAASDRPLVTVNGCFDILHIGHVRFLATARGLGQRLVVLANDDASVARYKGPTRPVFPIGFRAAALTALRSVDAVVPFSGDNPLGLIRDLRPDVHVKGGSYEPDRVRQEQELMESLGGRLVCTDLVAGFSTSTYIEKATPAG